MEEEISRMKKFLTEFNNEQISPTSEEFEFSHVRVVHYALEDPEDVTGQVIDWVLDYLDSRKCPYSLALSIAKEIARQMSVCFLQNEVGDAEKVPNAATIYTEAMSKISAVCNAFSNQANLESICSAKYATSVFAIKNKRRKMEDRHVIHHDLNAVLDLKDAPYQSYYAVFDGHSGIDAACYASAHLHANIAKHPDFYNDTCKAIIEGYQITDLNFLNKCNKWNVKSGCTAVCAFIRENTIYLSWLGDSQAVLVKGGVPATVTSPHKPEREDERQRIESLGGHISFVGTWRVNGLLAVTRAIGDPDQKRFISSEPEVTVLKLDGTEDFLILACDGLWDALSPEDMTSVLYRYLAESSADEPLEAVAAKLVHQSKLQGSEDNITAIVIFLRDIKDVKENAVNFLPNPSMCVQSHDFMSMNGNVKMFNIESSDTPFSKPTVLELNAASSKKLKNAANVMSSAGFGSASYSLQFVENSAEGSFETVDTSVVEGAQNFFVSQNISASCIAPEATALSELPTPPIDDMLASQQSESFYSTDLYKEFDSMHDSQNVQPVDDDNSNADISSGPMKPSESPSVNVSSQPFSDIVTGVNNMSLLDTESSISTNPDAKVSPDEAVGIASDVVSTTIETAVKCISSSETQDPVSVHSQLNPYAKPFIMKSFFTPEESESKDISFKNSTMEDISVMPCEEPKMVNQLVTETAATINTGNVLTTDEKLNQSFVDVICDKPTTQESIFVEDNKCSEQMPENIVVNKSLQDISNPETALEQISSEENVSEVTSQSIFQEENKRSDVSDFLNKTPENVNFSSGSTVVTENIQTDMMNILPSSEESKNSNLSPLSPESVASQSKTPEQESAEFVTEFVKETVAEHNQNINVDNSVVVLSFEKMTTEYESKYEAVGKNIVESELVQLEPHVKTTEQMLVTETPIHVLNTTEPDKLELNQNLNLGNVSVSLNSENTLSKEAEIKSKYEEIQKCIVEAVEKEAEIKSKYEEIQKCIVEAVEKSGIVSEPVSLINIKDELIPTEAEVPSDPSVEDSRTETVAVDLKSLPEGIPEAEGVTEDIDSDSEKDGGWSYMKGNTVSGSKSKPDEKVSKPSKMSDVKSSTASRVKRDISKPSVDVKSRARTVALDKTKSTVADKSKGISDRVKNVTSSDKTKNVTLVDKTKTLTSVDKSKKLAVEKKPDVKTRVMKSSTLTTSSTTRVTADKTSRATAVSSIKKETSEVQTKTTITKSTRPTTLLRSHVPAAKPAGISAPDRSTTAYKVVAKPRANVTPSESKTSVKNTNSSALTKVQTSNQSKSSSISTRTAPVRPTSTVPSKTSTITKSPLPKPTVSDPKQKPSTATTTMKKPLASALKKTDVKEVKNSVNKEIVAKKTTTTRKVESTLTNRKPISASNKSTISKVSGIAARSEISKGNSSKASPLKSMVKNAESKVSSNASKSKEENVDSVKSKENEAKNTLNVESDQKNVSEMVEVMEEEKFILEAGNKEKVVKESGEVSNEHVVENGSLITPVTPEAEAPVIECTPESL